MAIVQFRLTDENPHVLFGGTSLLLNKIVIRKGDIDDLHFELSWQTNDPLNFSSKISHSISFNSIGYIDTSLNGSDGIFEFRKTNYPPVYNFEKNIKGVLLTAYTENSKPFDFDIHVVVNLFSRLMN